MHTVKRLNKGAQSSLFRLTLVLRHAEQSQGDAMALNQKLTLRVAEKNEADILVDRAASMAVNATICRKKYHRDTNLSFEDIIRCPSVFLNLILSTPPWLRSGSNTTCAIRS